MKTTPEFGKLSATLANKSFFGELSWKDYQPQNTSLKLVEKPARVVPSFKKQLETHTHALRDCEWAKEFWHSLNPPNRFFNGNLKNGLNK